MRFLRLTKRYPQLPTDVSTPVLHCALWYPLAAADGSLDSNILIHLVPLLKTLACPFADLFPLDPLLSSACCHVTILAGNQASQVWRVASFHLRRSWCLLIPRRRLGYCFHPSAPKTGNLATPPEEQMHEPSLNINLGAYAQGALLLLFIKCFPGAQPLHIVDTSRYECNDISSACVSKSWIWRPVAF